MKLEGSPGGESWRSWKGQWAGILSKYIVRMYEILKEQIKTCFKMLLFPFTNI